MWEGNYSGVGSEQKQKRLSLRSKKKTESKRQRTLQRELGMDSHVAESAPGEGAKRCLNAYDALLAQDTNEKLDRVEIYIPPGPRLGDIVVEARGVKKGYGDKLLVEDMTFTLPKGGIVGIIGPNGAGKTTLFRMLVGQEQPDAGTLRIGETVQIGYVDQSREALDANKTVFEEITGGDDEVVLGKKTVNARAYCSWFNFRGKDQQRKVGSLSGGERCNRLHLAKLLKKGSNLLLLDEPTNDTRCRPRCARSSRRSKNMPAASS